LQHRPAQPPLPNSTPPATTPSGGAARFYDSTRRAGRSSPVGQNGARGIPARWPCSF